MFRKQPACFASSLIGILQASFNRIPALGRNIQNARHDPAENGEDNEEKHEAENHLSQTRPEQELMDGRYERIGGDQNNCAAYRHKPLRP